MILTTLTLLAVIVSACVYLGIAIKIYGRADALADHLPMSPGDRGARVSTATEFSATTTAVTISLATLILAYAELAPWAGLWLLWTVVTTAMGILVVRLATPRIWARISQFSGTRPTLHEFLGTSFASPLLAKTAALCTSLGFLGALALELSVGSRFLATLAPAVPTWAAVIALVAIGVGFTTLAGFRGVTVAGRAQMWAIWGAIAALSVAIAWQTSIHGGLGAVLSKLPPSVYDFSWREGMGAFLVGLVALNVPTFLGDMSIWQRIAAARSESIVRQGLTGSVYSAATSWTLLVFIACALVALVALQEGQNPLSTFLINIGESGRVGMWALFFVVVVGLYAANLSTAGSQLIATAHTLHTDILRSTDNRVALAASNTELRVARLLLLSAALISVGVVEWLRAVGFTIVDLVFAVFGAQLSIVPAVLLSLHLPPGHLKRLGRWATVAVPAGFFAGWTCAGYGKYIGDGTLVFLSPVASLLVSALLLGIGRGIVNPGRRT